MKLGKGVVLSLGEAATSRVLRKYFQKLPFIVYKEVPVRRVIEIDRQELKPGEWSYYTQSSFDFVICNDDNAQSYEMVVEYDGRQHEEPAQARKDALKNCLCMQVGIPILRIGIDDVKIRANTRFLEYILDLYFGEKAVDDLREKGLASWEDEYFPGTQFPGTNQIQKRLMKKGILSYAGIVFVDRHYGRAEAERFYWYRILDRHLTEVPGKSPDVIYNEATVSVEIFKGPRVGAPIIKTQKTAKLRECNPSYSVPGVYGWFLALELARFMCFEDIERRVRKLFK